MIGFVGVTVVQVNCCPTNTHNVWATSYVGEDVTDLMKKLIVFIWPAVAIGIVIGGFLYY